MQSLKPLLVILTVIILIATSRSRSWSENDKLKKEDTSEQFLKNLQKDDLSLDVNKTRTRRDLDVMQNSIEEVNLDLKNQITATKDDLSLNVNKNRTRRDLEVIQDSLEVELDLENQITATNLHSFYSHIPFDVQAFSHLVLNRTTCDSLNVPLHHIGGNQQLLESMEPLDPSWIENAVIFGHCPTMYHVRRLSNMYMPSSIVEAKCLCTNSLCHQAGGDFRCVEVKKNAVVWYRHRGRIVPDVKVITVGCVCAVIPAPYGDFTEDPSILN